MAWVEVTFWSAVLWVIAAGVYAPIIGRVLRRIAAQQTVVEWTCPRCLETLDNVSVEQLTTVVRLHSVIRHGSVPN